MWEGLRARQQHGHRGAPGVPLNWAGALSKEVPGERGTEGDRGSCRSPGQAESPRVSG